jgi:hypothetical protein
MQSQGNLGQHKNRLAEPKCSLVLIDSFARNARLKITDHQALFCVRRASRNAESKALQ